MRYKKIIYIEVLFNFLDENYISFTTNNYDNYPLLWQLSAFFNFRTEVWTSLLRKYLLHMILLTVLPWYFVMG